MSAWFGVRRHLARPGSPGTLCTILSEWARYTCDVVLPKQVTTNTLTKKLKNPVEVFLASKSQLGLGSLFAGRSPCLSHQNHGDFGEARILGGVQKTPSRVVQGGLAQGQIGSRRHLAENAWLVSLGSSGGAQRPCRVHLHIIQLGFEGNPYF